MLWFLMGFVCYGSLCAGVVLGLLLYHNAIDSEEVMKDE